MRRRRCSLPGRAWGLRMLCAALLAACEGAGPSPAGADVEDLEATSDLTAEPQPDGAASVDAAQPVCPDDEAAVTARAEAVLAGCRVCHAASLTGDGRQGATPGVDFDTEADVRRFAERIRVRTIDQGTMPPWGPVPTCDAAALSAFLTALEAAPCAPDCAGRVCGDDGCGGLCGDCDAASRCDANGQCAAAPCVPDCEGRSCGDDGCGGTCGACADGLTCDAAGLCACVPDCEDRACGEDGCGGSCGGCAPGLVCGPDGACRCVPACEARVCGEDGCSNTQACASVSLADADIWRLSVGGSLVGVCEQDPG